MSIPKAVLPDELWAEIFLRLQGRVQDDLCSMDFAPGSVAEVQSKFHQLRLVCRKFNDVIKGHPGLSRCLVLSPALRCPAFPSLQAWLQQHAASVETLAAYCEYSGHPCLETAIAKLSPPQTRLVDVFLSGRSSLAVPHMSGLTSMTHCHIYKPGHNLHLTPLKELTKLQKLHLSHGHFLATDLPAHLTNLTVEVAIVTIQHSPLGLSCVTSLQKLQVGNGAHISGLHPSGLLACSAVEQLQLLNCSIKADEPGCYLHVAGCHKSSCLPIGMSALTLLSRLAVTFGSCVTVTGTNPIDLGLLHALPLLQDLFLRSEDFSISLRLPAELGALQKLTCLTLSAPVWDVYDNFLQDCECFPAVRLDIEWGSMHALQCLAVHNWHFSCTSSILALTTLPHLSDVTFENCTPVGIDDHDDIDNDIRGEESSYNYFCRTMQHIVRHCPHVQLVYDEELVA